MDLKLLGMCGSLRAESWNRKLMREAVHRFGPAAFTEADMRLPLYDGDFEDAHGIPEEVQRLADAIAVADAVLLVTPEYNQSLSGVMKNALDWISRTEGAVWRDKPVASMSAAAGRAGGARAQFALRLCMVPFRPFLIPGPEVMVANPAEAFDAEGRMTSERYGKALDELVEQLRAAAVARQG